MKLHSSIRIKCKQLHYNLKSIVNLIINISSRLPTSTKDDIKNKREMYQSCNSVQSFLSQRCLFLRKTIKNV